MSTDGVVIDSGTTVDLSTSAVDITAALLDNNAKDSDDALVLAARVRGVNGTS